ncbi:MAG: JAB domain-containing protein, partial [Lachnospiraceae bacterium]
VSQGTLNSSEVSPREVFKSSILSNSAAVLLFHNHPSGDVKPSKQDYEATKRLVQCGKLLGIPVMV